MTKKGPEQPGAFEGMREDIDDIDFDTLSPLFESEIKIEPEKASAPEEKVEEVKTGQTKTEEKTEIIGIDDETGEKFFAPKKEPAQIEKNDKEKTGWQKAEEWRRANIQERKKFIEEHAPKLEEKDFTNNKGERVDFSQAQNLEELVRMISREEYIVYENEKKLPSLDVINLVYNRVLNRHDFNKDWTKITLRHRLRETAYALAEDYVNRPEFQTLAGLNLENVKSMEDLNQALLKHSNEIRNRGGSFDNQIISNAMSGKIELLPEPLKYKIKQIQKNKEKETLEKSSKPVWQKTFSKIRSWFSR